MTLDKEQAQKYYDFFKNDLLEFGKYFFPHWFSAVSGEFQRVICVDLTKNHAFYALEVFRGGAKTTYSSMLKAIHFSLFDRIGDITITSLSEEFVLNEITRKIKFEFESNQRLITFFGKMQTSKWTESYFVLRNGIAFEGTGISGQLRGGRRGLIICDDLEDEQNAVSSEQRDKLKRRIHKELIPKLLPKAQMILAGTPIHQLAYIHQIISTSDNGWIKRVFPAYKDGREEAGFEMWPQMYSHQRLQQIKKAMGSLYFAGEYLCNPLSNETAAIKDYQIRTWTEMPRNYSCVIAVDPAYSEDESADYKVASVIAIDSNSNRYLAAYLRTRSPLGEFEDGIINLYLQFKSCITGVGIPNSGVEKSFFASFLKKCETRKLFPPIVELKNSFASAQTQVSVKNKFRRIIAALQPLFEAGKYYIRPEHLEARDELLSLTPAGGSRFDDIIDTMAYAEEIIQPIYFDAGNNNNEEFIEEQELVNTSYGL